MGARRLPSSPPALLFALTSFHLILQGLLAVHNQLLQAHRTLGDLQLQELLHILRMVEVEHLLVAVIRGFDKVQQHVDDLQQELLGLGSCCNICGQQI